MSDTTNRNDVLLSAAAAPLERPVINEEAGGGIPGYVPEKSEWVCPPAPEGFGKTPEGMEKLELPPTINIPEHWLGDKLVVDGKEVTTGTEGINYNWTGNVHDYVDPYFVSNMDFGSFKHYYPFNEGIRLKLNLARSPEPEEFLEEWDINGEKIHNYTKVCAALHHFFTTVKPAALAVGCVMTYQGYQGDTEVTYIRFERDHVDPITFVLRADSFGFFIDMWYDGVTNPVRQQTAIGWCREDNNSPGMIARGNKRMINQISMEWPLSWIRPIDLEHKWDGLLNGDFQRTEDVIAAFNGRFDRFIAMATKQAERIAPKVKFRDHTLMLVFKGNEDLNCLVIGLDKVPGRLPDSGEYSLGDKPIDLAEWAHLGNDVLVAVRKVGKVSQWVDQLIEESYKSLPDHPYCRAELDKVIKTRLLASSHFMKELYKINPRDVQGYVEKVANDVMTALHNHGGNIGLDLNSWRVYQYFEDGTPPIPMVKEELNFRKSVFDVHTDHMVGIIYAYMFTIKSPYLRPYANRVKADLSDGIPIGSIRPVKREEMEATLKLLDAAETAEADDEPVGKDEVDV